VKLGRLNKSWEKVKKAVCLISFMSNSSKIKLGKGVYSKFLNLKDDKVRISKWVILEVGQFNIVWGTISNITYCFSFILIPLVIMSRLHLLDAVRIPELIIDFILAIDI
jgi:hypothetical protein